MDQRQLITILDVDRHLLQAYSIARTFTGLAGWRTRLLVPERGTNLTDELASFGVDNMIVDLYDVATIWQGFAGSSVIFASTDFWYYLRDTMFLDHAHAACLQPDKAACDEERTLGFAIVKAAAATSGLDCFILSTINGPEHFSSGEITEVYNFNAKWDTAMHLQESYPSLASITTFFQPGLAMQDVKKFSYCDRTGMITITPPVPERLQLPWFAPSMDTGPIVQNILSHNPRPVLIAAVSEYMSFRNICRQLSKTSGIHFKCNSFSHGKSVNSSNSETTDADKNGFQFRMENPSANNTLTQMWSYIRKYGYFGSDDTLFTRPTSWILTAIMFPILLSPTSSVRTYKTYLEKCSHLTLVRS